MAGEQRKCANCRYFRDAEIAGNGWCTHPKRQTTSDARLLVRAGELACRNSWGNDLFESKNVPGAPTDADAISDLPLQGRDDEVTSVITPPDRSSDDTPSDAEDRVVSDRPAPPRRNDTDDEGFNDAAHRDQDERARLIARSDRDALMRARQRHSSRKSQPQRESDEDSSDPEPPSRDRVASHQVRFTDRKRSRFTQDHTAPVPREEVEQRSPRRGADRFNSIPEIDPDFDLPAWRSGQPEDAAEADDARGGDIDEVPGSDAAEKNADTLEPRATSFEHALQRARRIREEKRTTRRPIRHASPAPSSTPPPEIEGDWDNTQIDASDVWDNAGDEPALAGDRTTHDLVPERESDAEHEGASAYALEMEDAHSHDGSTLGYVDEVDTSDESDHNDDADQDPWEGAYDYEDARRERPGWLSRFGLRRSSRSDMHDDGMVSRHTEHPLRAEEHQSSWDEEYPEDAYLLDVDDDAWETRPENQEVDLTASDSTLGEDTDDAVLDNRVWSSNVDRALPDPEDDHLVAYNNMDGRPEAVPSSRSRYIGRSESMHRTRHTPQLPDLDDNLFEEQFDRSEAQQRSNLPFDRPAAPSTHSRDWEESNAPDARAQATPVVDRPEVPVAAASARDSYFRASHYRDWRNIDEDGTTAAPLGDDEELLPDLAEPDFDIREIVERGSELLDMTIEVAPELPRACRTCRSFRSADGGTRGWCTNEWAFTHRRMVNEDDLACDSTIGCWWLPADRYWLIEEQDGYAATPRMDRLIARVRGRDTEESRSSTGAS